MNNPFKLSHISNHIWSTRYQYNIEGEAVDKSIEDTWSRVSNAVASLEKEPQTWATKYYKLLSDFKFLPGGRIIAGAGTRHDVTLLNCFVMGQIEDSMEGIFDGLREGAITMQAGGGIGYDFSTLRPRGESAKKAGTISSGPVSFMKIWNAMCSTVLSTGMRRGAMMATLRCDHPDIFEFISEKSKSSELKHFNLSVLVTDELVKKVKSGGDIDLKFKNKIYKTIPATQLWDAIMQNTFEHSEPGVLFIDRVNQENNLNYIEHISATNPCGEIPLPAYGACNLGSINLTQFVSNSFLEGAKFNWTEFENTIPTAVRFLDNVIEISRYPLEKQKTKEQNSRRLGLGITGLADALVRLNLKYTENEALIFVSKVFETLRNVSYQSSIDLALERGAFAEFDKNKYSQNPFIRRLPSNIQERINTNGIRNSHLIAIAPAGTISLLANNISSGIEPIFSIEQRRRILNISGEFEEFHIQNAAWMDYQKCPRPLKSKDELFLRAEEVSPNWHLQYLKVAQPFVDNSISKTINVKKDIPFEELKNVYMHAYESGLKGCTTFRPNPKTGSILLST